MTKNKQYSTQNMKLQKKSQYRIKNITNIFHLDLVLHDLLYQIQRQTDFGLGGQEPGRLSSASVSPSALNNQEQTI